MCTYIGAMERTEAIELAPEDETENSMGRATASLLRHIEATI